MTPAIRRTEIFDVYAAYCQSRKFLQERRYESSLNVFTKLRQSFPENTPNSNKRGRNNWNAGCCYRKADISEVKGCFGRFS